MSNNIVLISLVLFYCAIRKKKWTFVFSRNFSFPLLFKTSLPVEAIFKFLKKEAFDVMISNDAGRFVCNYVYYHSLRFAEQHGNKSLFVHVPLFSRINEETQMRFTASLLDAIASAL